MKTTEQMIEVMQAAARGERIEWKHPGDGENWHESDCQYWNWSDYDYRVAPKPKKQIKMLAWFDRVNLFWAKEAALALPSWTRVPSEDKIIEVEE